MIPGLRSDGVSRMRSEAGLRGGGRASASACTSKKCGKGTGAKRKNEKGAHPAAVGQYRCHRPLTVPQAKIRSRPRSHREARACRGGLRAAGYLVRETYARVIACPRPEIIHLPDRGPRRGGPQACGMIMHRSASHYARRGCVRASVGRAAETRSLRGLRLAARRRFVPPRAVGAAVRGGDL